MVFTLIAIAFFSAGFSSLLDFCFEKTGIFNFWLPLLAKILNYKHKTEIKEYEYWVNYAANSKQRIFFYPLGYCLYCTSVWTAFAFYLIIGVYHFQLDFNIFDMFLTSFAAFSFIILINKN